jgi:hypothetical protein
MKFHRSLATIVLLLGGTSAAHAAQTLVSAALPTPSGTGGACYIRNVGRAPISLQAAMLENFTPGFIAPDVDTCSDTPLAAGKTCVLLVNDLPDDVTFECSAQVTAGSVKNLRGTAELRQISDVAQTVIAAQDMK